MMERDKQKLADALVALHVVKSTMKNDDKLMVSIVTIELFLVEQFNKYHRDCLRGITGITGIISADGVNYV